MAIGKTPLDALREWWGERIALRRTHGDPKLTKAFILCDYLESDLKIPGMKVLGEKLLHGRAGELGWDTDTSIRAIEAASEKGATIQSNRRDE
jgi:hypothetical protein